MWITGLVALAAVETACAQAWLAKAVRIIVPWAPGDAIDIVMRPLAQALSESLGRQFLVDNRAD